MKKEAPKNGPRIEYHKNGQKLTEENYKDGKLMARGLGGTRMVRYRMREIIKTAREMASTPRGMKVAKKSQREILKIIRYLASGLIGTRMVR